MLASAGGASRTPCAYARDTILHSFFDFATLGRLFTGLALGKTDGSGRGGLIFPYENNDDLVG